MASSWSTQTATAHWQGEKILSLAMCLACSRMETGGSRWGVCWAHTASAPSTAPCSQVKIRPRKQAIAGCTPPRLGFVWLI